MWTVLEGRTGRWTLVVFASAVGFAAFAMQSAFAGPRRSTSVHVAVLHHSRLLGRSKCGGGGLPLNPGEPAPPCAREITGARAALLATRTGVTGRLAVVSGTVNISSTIAPGESARVRVALYSGERKVEGATVTVSGESAVQIPIQAVVRDRGQAVALVVRHEYEQASEHGAIRIVGASLIAADH